MGELDWIRNALQDRRIPVIAQKTGLSEPTIRAVREGKGNPTIATLNTLAEYLRCENGQ